MTSLGSSLLSGLAGPLGVFKLISFSPPCKPVLFVLLLLVVSILILFCFLFHMLLVPIGTDPFLYILWFAAFFLITIYTYTLGCIYSLLCLWETFVGYPTIEVVLSYTTGYGLS